MNYMSQDKRRKNWDRAFSPGLLAMSGLAFSIILLLQRHIHIRSSMLFFAIFAAWMSGRKIKPFFTAFVMLGIVAANLLIPIGKKLATFGPIIITELALLDGIKKAITFEALIFISKATFSAKIRWPGKFGLFVSEALSFYEQIIEYKPKTKIKKIIPYIDETLLMIYNENSIYKVKVQPSNCSGTRWNWLCVIVVVFFLSLLAL